MYLHHAVKALLISQLLALTLSEECQQSDVPFLITGAGVITSPGYSMGKYTLGAKCSMEIQFPINKFLRLEFTDMDIEKHHQCFLGRLDIKIDNMTETYCSDSIPSPLTISGKHRVRLIFQAGPFEPFRGFRLEYRLLNKPGKCPSKYKCLSKSCKKNQKLQALFHCSHEADQELNVKSHIKAIAACGVPVHDPRLGNGADRIVGGAEAVPHSWPFQVSFQTNHIHPSGHFCGGALINSQWILSAAHCFQYRINDTIRVKLGDHYTYKHEPGEFNRLVDRIFIHEGYNPETIQHDIALIKLDVPVVFSDKVLPICLPKSELPLPAIIHTMGWGETYDLGPSEVLKQAMLPLIPWDTCKSLAPLPLSEDMICAGFGQGAHGICSADSGGPMVYQDKGRWTLYGVVSWGALVCGTRPSVFSDVLYHMPWIRTILNQHL